MIPFADALESLRRDLAPVGVEIVNVASGLGRVLANAPEARVAQPPAAVAAMDGFAVAAAGLAGQQPLAVVGTAAAGAPLMRAVAPGEAARILTGAPLPEGTDTVIRQEEAHLDADGATVSLPSHQDAGRAVRTAGLDFAKGDRPLTAPRRLTARDVALAAALDHPWLTVRRRPVVAILAGGDELALPGCPRPEAGLPNSNGPGLAAAIQAMGAEARLLPAAPDEIAATRQLVASHAGGADLLITAGGAAVGQRDIVRASLAELGYRETYWQVAVRPGKPVFYGRIGDLGELPVLGVPGNPVSALVCASLFAKTALDALNGFPSARCGPPAPVSAQLMEAIPQESHRHSFLRGRWAPISSNSDLPGVVPREGQDSAMIAELANSDVLIERPPHAPARAAGEAVTVRPLGFGAAGV